jgi:hypothetical protein
MKFKSRNLRAIAECVVGNAEYFPYRSSSYISQFFEECDLPYRHDGTSRIYWTADRLEELLAEPAPQPNMLPHGFARVLRVLLDRSEAEDGDEDRSRALEALNVHLRREGFEAFFDEDHVAQFRHIATKKVSEVSNPHRPFTPQELERRELLAAYLDRCTEDQLIIEVLLPMFRQLGFHRITSAGHEDKALEYGKDVWMRFTLPTMHMLYFGIQAKKGKIDSAGVSRGNSRNIAEIHNQVQMMLGHEIFDPEMNRRVLVDHVFIIAGGEITKQARNWLGGKLDQMKRSQIQFMDRDDILNLFVVSNIPLPPDALPPKEDTGWSEIPF